MSSRNVAGLIFKSCICTHFHIHSMMRRSLIIVKLSSLSLLQNIELIILRFLEDTHPIHPIYPKVPHNEKRKNLILFIKNQETNTLEP